MKRVLLDSLKKKDIENSFNEIRIIASLNSQYIVQFKEAFIDLENKYLCIIMEYVNGGDLQILIKNH